MNVLILKVGAVTAIALSSLVLLTSAFAGAASPGESITERQLGPDECQLLEDGSLYLNVQSELKGGQGQMWIFSADCRVTIETYEIEPSQDQRLTSALSQRA